jgi:hypothetical protein
MTPLDKALIAILGLGIISGIVHLNDRKVEPQPIAVVSRESCSADHPTNLRLMDFSIASEVSGEGAGIPVTIVHIFDADQEVYLTAHIEGCAPCPPEVEFIVRPKDGSHPGWSARLLCNPRWPHLAQVFPGMHTPGEYTAAMEIAGVRVAEKEFTVRGATTSTSTSTSTSLVWDRGQLKPLDNVQP